MSKNNTLFSEFNSVSSKQWKQQIQFDLKGEDYNQTLVWESPEGIKVKPFYHSDQANSKLEAKATNNGFSIQQNIFVHDVKKSNERALDSLNRGAENIRFTLQNETISIEDLMQNLPLENATYYFYFPFISVDLALIINKYATINHAKFVILIDPIGQLCKDGNWFESLDKDFLKLDTISKNFPQLANNIIAIIC